MKTCTKCGEIKSTTEFYRHAKNKDGRQSYCKTCTNTLSARWKAENAERKAATDARWKAENAESRARWAADNAESVAAYVKHWRATNPEKRAAHLAVRNALRDGRLVARPCIACGDEKSQGHHPDYSKPLDVVWLCDKHHRALHRDMRKAKQSGAIA